MKKSTARRIANSESGRKKVLRLSRETVRRLSSGDLSQAIGGSCDTTTDTTLSTTRTKVNTIEQG